MTKSSMNKTARAGDEIVLFATPEDWVTWLAQHHATSEGLWMRLAKKGCGLQSVTYAQALEVALCYGWIDGQKRGDSEQAWLQRFLPRSAKSIWSKLNREKAMALIACNRMKPAGLAAIEAAKEDGRWAAAYDSPKGAKVPDDFAAALSANPRAKEFFATLNGANRYAVLFRIQTVKKAETRARKIQEFVRMLARYKRIHEPPRARRTSKSGPSK
jgi:uncharacterized protein YdeI (YjbR/CyaY-like superfamily)